MLLNAQAALVAVIAATGQTRAGKRLCERLLDAAVEALDHGGAETMGADGPASIALVTAVCASCKACPRGWLAEGAVPVEVAVEN